MRGATSKLLSEVEERSAYVSELELALEEERCNTTADGQENAKLELVVCAQLAPPSNALHPPRHPPSPPPK